MTHAVAPQD